MALCIFGDYTMKKIDPTILKETKYIAAFVCVLSLLTEAIFLILGKWEYTVLLGNLLGALGGILNFFLMGLTVQSALTKDEKDARATVRASQLYRNLMLAAVALVGILLPCFHGVAAVIPLFFPRIAIAFRPLFLKKQR